MRNLPHNRTPKQNLIIRAVYDFFGSGMPKKDKGEANKIALCLMGRKKGIVLDGEQMANAERIRENLGDKVYISSLADNTPQEPPNFALNIKSY